LYWAGIQLTPASELEKRPHESQASTEIYTRVTVKDLKTAHRKYHPGSWIGWQYTKERYINSMGWTVNLKTKVVKQLKRLPQSVRNSLVALIRDIEANGPVRGNWSNYGKLDTDRHHCHLKKEHSTYVAV
jgi:mRNA-degrading endonuclease RelE of RelBE toxin-antitoxin system